MKSSFSFLSYVCACLLLQIFVGSSAFLAPTSREQWRQPKPWVTSSSAPGSHHRIRLHIFPWNKKDKEEEEPDEQKEEAKDEETVPFFARLRRGKNETTTPEPPTPSVATAAVQDPPEKDDHPVALKKPEVNIDDLSPAEKASALRAQAEKARLEAERMDAELTLKKIARLEKELAHAKAKGADSVEDLQREMDALEAKMRGEAPKQVVARSAAVAKPVVQKEGFQGNFEAVVEPFSQEDFEEAVNNLEYVPSFMKALLARQFELDFDKPEDINVTELALRYEKLERMDYSDSKKPRPKFSQEEIDRKRKELKDDWALSFTIDPRIKEAAKGNDTELALLVLENEYFAEGYLDPDKFGEGFIAGLGGENLEDLSKEELEKLMKESDTEWLMPVVDAMTETAVDSSIETLYPKCTRKTGMEPTEAQVQLLSSEVLPKASFSPTAKPEKVNGGFIIRGTNKAENGDALIEAIDKQLEKSNLADKVTVLYTNDFTLFATEDVEEVNFDEAPPILYVTGPNIVPERRRVLLSITTALGVASTWYLSIYPFLLNPALSQRVDQDLALADANMAPDLSWLTDLSIPLFVTFFGIQALHELGHRIAAAANGIEVTFPTFVPSLITGITSSVTTFKTLPKNKDAMFDFSIAGPLTGILASVAAIVVGAQLTVSGDPSNFPALPLEILRQSTLGGGIIDSMLGGGALSVPDGAVGTSAVAGMTIPLHPVAVAGYISLVVNSLSLIPVGTTDGGRIGLSLFGRGAKLLVGNLFLLAILLTGLLGSDLFLFYFAFVIAFQTGNEIPARNEADKISFSRVGVATVAYILGLLSLIPFQ